MYTRRTPDLDSFLQMTPSPEPSLSSRSRSTATPAPGNPPKREQMVIPPPDYQVASFQFRPSQGLPTTRFGADAERDFNNVATSDILLLVQSLDDVAEAEENNIEDIPTFPTFAHRIYLSRCPYFKEEASFWEAQSPIVTLTIPKNAHKFADVLRYVYTEILPPQLLEPRNVLSTYLTAEFLKMTDLMAACREAFKADWEKVIDLDEFHWSVASSQQVKDLSFGMNDMFDKYPERQLKMLFRWSRGWPEDRMHEIRTLVSEELKGRSDRLELQQIERLQRQFMEQFDDFVPPSLLMSVLKANMRKQLGGGSNSVRSHRESTGGRDMGWNFVVEKSKTKFRRSHQEQRKTISR
ncbi:hypothetical protein BJ742DRAFT_780974 [Cladochytrium replicatum]|nr:hypothetical protein BJ742DRAFT_780974 [Cladochytrium replicatum]